MCLNIFYFEDEFEILKIGLLLFVLTNFEEVIFKKLKKQPTKL